ncbi:glutathione S-transferase family protein [Tropicimonas isoalkanivorans]|uniref:Glutathione S-transferase n=1 Tax=Tropicimonas isoalkanivorans TaxID=441112 RepID=A0A1I1FVC2_9RHOB|nr:glutathione S-transferase family protein [Tropicimonas isoalkanivorans]SFC02982.1 glutathione S-transferase [Tropicimonas isoalkanivorans]
MSGITIYHIPVCPFSQRVEILLTLKGMKDRVNFHVVDVTEPRPDWLTAKTGGAVPLPVLETADGRILRESLVILRYIEELWPDPQVARSDPFERAVERMLITREGGFADIGYGMVLNQDRTQTERFREKMDAHYLGMSRFLDRHAPDGPFLFEDFGLAEAVFTPLFMRFWFLEYYEDYRLPDGPEAARVRRWHAACLDHPAAQQVSYREIVTLYYDYALGVGNGGVLPGREKSSFVFEPDWSDRPMPPAQKYGSPASDFQLGLL